MAYKRNLAFLKANSVRDIFATLVFLFLRKPRSSFSEVLTNK